MQNKTKQNKNKQQQQQLITKNFRPPFGPNIWHENYG